MSVRCYDEVQEFRARYPESRSLGDRCRALRLAQERHGWLLAGAFGEVAEALDLTPAYCQAVASFYDMFHLEPDRAAHESRSARTSACALVGAQRVVERVRAGARRRRRARRPRTALITLRARSSASAAAATRTVVAVDAPLPPAPSSPRTSAGDRRGGARWLSTREALLERLPYDARPDEASPSTARSAATSALARGARA